MIGKKENIRGKVLLLITTVIWGSAFFVLKNAIDKYPTFFVLALRFSVGAVCLGLIFLPRVIAMNRTVFIKGAALGLCLAVAYAIQTAGLKYTTPAKNAFLTAVYVVFVPFMYWAFFKKRPDGYHVIAAVFAIAGIGLVSLNGVSGVNSGDILTLVSGVFYALHIILLSQYAKKEDTIQLLIAELFTAGIFLWILSLSTETAAYPAQISFSEALPLLYLIIVATVVAQLFQMVGQKTTTASEAGLILCLEALFGTLFSVLFYKERISLQLGAGFTIIFIGLIISETKLEFIRKIPIKIKALKEKKNG